MELIKVKNISFGYNSQNDILKNININIQKNEFVCIVGENGSGKTTLLKCILGLNKPTKGKIETPKRIGYLPQINEIQNNFPATIEEVVLSGTIANNIKKIWYTKTDKEQSKKIMEELELYEIRKKSFCELSGGQKQRVLIARALCSTEEIMLLDEPVNGLDPKIVTQIYKLIQKLNKEKNITIVMVSHDVHRALQYSNRVIELTNGEVTYDGLPSNYEIGGAK